MTKVNAKVVVYVLCYDAESERKAREAWPASKYPWARVARLPDDPRLSKYMEAAAYLTVLQDREAEWRDADYVGTLSWRAHSKIAVPESWEPIILDNPDVVPLMPLADPMVLQAARSHPRFLEIYVPLLAALGHSSEKAVSPDIPGFVCNYWLSRPAWMRRYTAWLARAVEVMETAPELQEALWADASYQSAGLPAHRVREVYGRDAVPHHPFVTERLPCFFFWSHGARVAPAPLALQQFWFQHYTAMLHGVRQRARACEELLCASAFRYAEPDQGERKAVVCVVRVRPTDAQRAGWEAARDRLQSSGVRVVVDDTSDAPPAKDAATFVGTLAGDALDAVDLSPRLADMCEHVRGADVVALCPSAEALVPYHAARHPGFVAAWIAVLQAMGYAPREALAADIPLFVGNHWLATPAAHEGYAPWKQRFEEAVAALAGDQALRRKLLECAPCFYFWKTGAAVSLLPLGRPEFWEAQYQRDAREVHEAAQVCVARMCAPEETS